MSITRLALLLLLAGVGEGFNIQSLRLLEKKGGCASRTQRFSLVTMLAGKPKSDKLQVILNSNIEGVGKKNDVVQVSSGYFNNYLRARGLASAISDEELKAKQDKEREHLAKLKQDAINIASTINALSSLTFSRKIGETGKLFGTVTHKQIVEEIKAKTGGTVDISTKVKMEVPEIHGLGEFTATIHLHPEVISKLKVKVVKEK